MFVYYDNKGIVKEIVNDTAIRQGDSGTDYIYFFIEGADPQVDSNNVYQVLTFASGRRAFTYFDPETETENKGTLTSFDLETIELEIPYDKKRELKFFKYWTKYQFFKIKVEDAVLNASGSATCRIQMVNEDTTMKVLGLIVFNVEMTTEGAIIEPDTAINIAQWNYLISHMLTKDDIDSGIIEQIILQYTDDELSLTSEHPVQNKVVTEALNDKVSKYDSNSNDWDTSATQNSTKPVTSGGLFNDLNNVREVAEGKCKSIVISYATTAPTTDIEAQALKKLDGTNFTDLADFSDYIEFENESGVIINSSFNSQNNSIGTGCPGPDYIITEDSYVLRAADNYSLKTGDIILVVETDVPDRWFDYSNDCSWKLETSKVEISNMVTTDTDQTITAVKTIADTSSANSPKLQFQNEYTTLGLFANGYQLKIDCPLYVSGNLTVENNLMLKFAKVTDSSAYFEVARISDSATIFYADVNEFNGRHIVPMGNNAFDLGKSSSVWKDLYLGGTAYIPAVNNEAGDIAVTVGNDKALKPSWDAHYNLGNSSYKWKDLYLSGSAYIPIIEDSASISFKINGIERFKLTGADALTGRLYPSINNTFDLGTGSYKYKDLYLSGKAYIPEIADSNGTSRLSISSAGIVTLNGNMYPNANNASLLGYSARVFNTVYTTNLSDGTNSVTVAQLAQAAAGVLYRHNITVSDGTNSLQFGFISSSSTAITTLAALDAVKDKFFLISGTLSSGGREVCIIGDTIVGTSSLTYIKAGQSTWSSLTVQSVSDSPVVL